MRTIAAVLASLALGASALANEVRVKSKHERLPVEGDPQAVLFKLGPLEVLRGATIGPGAVRVVLRRLAPPGPPIAVTLQRDGRDVGRVVLASKPRDKVAGATLLASSAQERTIEIPPGPHTLFVEVGKGDGFVLVAFPAEQLPQPVPLVRATVPAPPATAEPTIARAEPPSTDSLHPERPAASPIGPSAEGTPGRIASAPEGLPARPSGPAVGETRPAPDGPARGSLSTARPVPRQARSARLLLGLRAGGAAQIQFGAPGPAFGLCARFPIWGDPGDPAGAGLSLGMSGDYLRYQLAFRAGPSRAIREGFTETVTITSFPVLAEATWQFSTAGRIKPLFGVAAGAVFGSVGAQGPGGTSSLDRPILALGVHAGAEAVLGNQRFGIELRLVSARTGEDNGAARNLQIGGALAQATWRVAL